MRKKHLKDNSKLFQDNLKKETSIPRANWSSFFKQMHKNGDDKLLIDDFFKDEKLEAWN